MARIPKGRRITQSTVFESRLLIEPRLHSLHLKRRKLVAPSAKWIERSDTCAKRLWDTFGITSSKLTIMGLKPGLVFEDSASSSLRPTLDADLKKDVQNCRDLQVATTLAAKAYIPLKLLPITFPQPYWDLRIGFHEMRITSNTNDTSIAFMPDIQSIEISEENQFDDGV
ncbi:hypothetical protein GYMLUDRAFT_252651 [Collybiopsis luxurians FD-317 M1]|uniref:Uncharacterized protein n=1 Tax=Collybiopsis luxurians FD-317 M1 TaxID=944289 RepID=A0A0D0BZI3_9AGAR|nr:hypothetical protein GYMLUDRAFT_252651 [Collybiopsis luxurians FD-317 M1]